MHAIIQSVEAMVFALATAALAHFGVALKPAPCPMDDHAHRRPAMISVSVIKPAPQPGAARSVAT